MQKKLLFLAALLFIIALFNNVQAVQIITIDKLDENCGLVKYRVNTNL